MVCYKQHLLMKSLFAFTTLLLFSLTGLAQQRIIPQAQLSVRQQKAPMMKRAILPETYVPEVVSGSKIVTESGAQYRDPEEPVNTTRWDAQVYGCMPSRI